MPDRPPSSCAEINGPPPYEPELWTPGGVRVWNNCYNYAVNIATGRISWPGRWKGDDGHKYEAAGDPGSCDYVQKGCELDGLELHGLPGVTTQDPCGPTCHEVALFTRSADASAKPPIPADFHFIRKDADGTWSHKQGELPPGRILKGGQPIRDPADFLTRDDTEHGKRGWRFCASYCVCHCKVDIEKEGDKTRWEDQHPGHKKKLKDKPRKRPPRKGVRVSSGGSSFHEPARLALGPSAIRELRKRLDRLRFHEERRASSLSWDTLAIASPVPRVGLPALVYVDAKGVRLPAAEGGRVATDATLFPWLLGLFPRRIVKRRRPPRV